MDQNEKLVSKIGIKKDIENNVENNAKSPEIIEKRFVRKDNITAQLLKIKAKVKLPHKGIRLQATQTENKLQRSFYENVKDSNQTTFLLPDIQDTGENLTPNKKLSKINLGFDKISNNMTSKEKLRFKFIKSETNYLPNRDSLKEEKTIGSNFIYNPSYAETEVFNETNLEIEGIHQTQKIPGFFKKINPILKGNLSSSFMDADNHHKYLSTKIKKNKLNTSINYHLNNIKQIPYKVDKNNSFNLNLSQAKNKNSFESNLQESFCLNADEKKISLNVSKIKKNLSIYRENEFTILKDKKSNIQYQLNINKQNEEPYTESYKNKNSIVNNQNLLNQTLNTKTLHINKQTINFSSNLLNESIIAEASYIEDLHFQFVKMMIQMKNIVKVTESAKLKSQNDCPDMHTVIPLEEIDIE